MKTTLPLVVFCEVLVGCFSHAGQPAPTEVKSEGVASAFGYPAPLAVEMVAPPTGYEQMGRLLWCVRVHSSDETFAETKVILFDGRSKFRDSLSELLKAEKRADDARRKSLDDQAKMISKISDPKERAVAEEQLKQTRERPDRGTIVKEFVANGRRIGLSFEFGPGGSGYGGAFQDPSQRYDLVLISSVSSKVHVLQKSDATSRYFDRMKTEPFELMQDAVTRLGDTIFK